MKGFLFSLRGRLVLAGAALVLLAVAFASPYGGAQPLARELQRLANPSPAVNADAVVGGASSGATVVDDDFEWPRPRQIARALRARVEQEAPVLFAELLAALFVLGFFYLLQRAVVRILHGVLLRTHADPAVSSVGIKLTRYVLLGVGVLTALQQIGVQVTSLLAGVGIAGLAVGFAAQDTIANLIAGFTLLLEKPFRIGDSVTIAGTSGQIIEIGLRSTHLRTVDVRDAFLPNKEIINGLIVNHTMTPQLRLDLPIGVSYEADLDAVRKLLLAVCAGHPLIADQPAPQLVVVALGDSAVNLELRIWLRAGRDDTGVRFEILEKAKKALEGAGIEIPFPQRVVRVLRPPTETKP
jgi:small-conductance mechanosensitive channel